MHSVNIIMRNWNWSCVIQWLHNILFWVLTVNSRFQTEFRGNGTDLSSQLSSLPLCRVETAVSLRTYLWKIFHRNPWSGGLWMCGGALYGLWYAILKDVISPNLANDADRLPLPAASCSWKESHLTLSNVCSRPLPLGGVANYSPLPGNGMTSQLPLRFSAKLVFL